MGSNTSRARRALAAMAALGFSRKQSLAALKPLVKLYANNWALIEDDSYRVLVDAILDVPSSPPQPILCSLLHHPLSWDIKWFSFGRGFQASGNGGPEQEQEEMDDDDIQAGGDASTSLGPPSPPSPTAEQEEMVVSPRPQAGASTRALRKRRHGETIDADPQLEDAAFLREPKPEPVDMDAPGCQDVQPCLIDPSRDASSEKLLRELPPLQPGRNPKQIPGARNRKIQRCRNRERTTLSVEPTSSGLNNGTGSGVVNVQGTPCLDIEVASSSMGEVKMSLKCSVDPSKFRMPALEAVFKMVESKCLRSYKGLPPDFSVGSLMTKICQCVVQLGTEHTVEHNTQSDVAGIGSRSEDGKNRKQVVEEKLLVSNRSESGPVNSTLAQQRRLVLSTSRTNHDVMDISKGEEKIRISIINESGREKCPPSFYYIPRSVVFQNAVVNMSLANIGGEDCCADCFGNCLSSLKPCACARETGGEYAYTLEGLVRPAFIDKCVSVNRFPEEHRKVFCKTCPLESSKNKASPESCRGHIVRKFIKECWSKCGCNMQCGNRVVQRGITRNLQVFFTGKGTGWGLRALDELPKGAFVCEYAGEILTNTELHERDVENMQNDKYVHPILLDAGWCSERVLKDEEALCLDGTFYGNVGRFINHRCCDANLAVVPVEVESPDHHYYHLAFFTSTKVEAFEELTWDYGINFDYEKQKPVKPFECLCGSRYCRGRRRHHQRKRSGTAAAAE